MTHMFDLFNEDDFNLAREEKLITERTDAAGDRVLNYSNKAMITKGAWANPAVRICRGLVVDNEGFVIARPWEKFFNYGQPEAGDLDLDAPVWVTDKMDGSLGVISLDGDGELRVSTRGSFSSEQALHATALLYERQYTRWDKLGDITPLVEIIYPENRIVCNYGDKDDLVLLGGVAIETGEYLHPDYVAEFIGWSGPVVQSFSYSTLREALAAEPRPGAEGLVVAFEGENHMVKIKQDDYLALHRIMFGMSERVVWRHLAVHACKHAITQPKHWGTQLGIDPADAALEIEKGEDWMEEAIFGGDNPFPDEVADWFERTSAEIRAKQRKLYAHGCAYAAMTHDIEDRRAQHEFVKNEPMVSEILWAARKSDYTSLWIRSWRELQPVGQAPAIYRSEEVA